MTPPLAPDAVCSHPEGLCSARVALDSRDLLMEVHHPCIHLCLGLSDLLASKRLYLEVLHALTDLTLGIDKVNWILNPFDPKVVVHMESLIKGQPPLDFSCP